jgi:hypothetical protein
MIEFATSLALPRGRASAATGYEFFAAGAEQGVEMAPVAALCIDTLRRRSPPSRAESCTLLANSAGQARVSEAGESIWSR